MIKPQYGLISVSIKFPDEQVWEITEGYPLDKMGTEELNLCFPKKKNHTQVEKILKESE